MWRYDGRNARGSDALLPVSCGKDPRYIDLLDTCAFWPDASDAYAYIPFVSPDCKGSKEAMLPAYRNIDDSMCQLRDLGYQSNSRQDEEKNVPQMSMKSQFQSLQSEDPATIFLLRRVSKLGLNGASILHRYFSTFGPVKNVYTTVSNQARGKGRPRLSHLAFVVMETSEAVSQILEHSEHVCHGQEITVKTFQSRAGCSDFSEASGAKWLVGQNQNPHSHGPKALRENLLAFPPLALAQSCFPSDDCELQQIIRMSL